MGIFSPFSQSIETRRRFGKLRMVFTRCALVQAQALCPSEGGGTREAKGAIAERLVGSSSTRKCFGAGIVGRVNTRFGEDGKQLDYCRRARGVMNPCMRE